MRLAPSEAIINDFHSVKSIKGRTLSPTTKHPLCRSGLCQEDIDYIGYNLKLYFDVLSRGRAQITLLNTGSKPIRNGKWAIYVCVLGIFQEEQLVNNHEDYVILSESDFKMTHINGCLYKFEPLSNFKVIASGEYIKLQLNTTLLRARCNLTPNWYVAGEGLGPRIIANTAGEDLGFVFTADKGSWDRFSAKSTASADLGHAPYMVIPTPKEVYLPDKIRNVSVGQDWRVYGQKGLENEVNFLASMGDICLFLEKKLSI